MGTSVYYMHCSMEDGFWLSLLNPETVFTFVLFSCSVGKGNGLKGFDTLLEDVICFSFFFFPREKMRRCGSLFGALVGNSCLT